MSGETKVRAGRPRALSADTSQSPLSPREQILDAAAALFVQHGFAATTTRAIAERVGIRQASLYYHYAGKDDLLVELLSRTVRPGLELANVLETTAHDAPAVALYTLAFHDAQALASTPHNVGTLYLLPELAHERFDDFRADRARLREAYGRWGVAAASENVRSRWSEPALGAMLIHLVEVVIASRNIGEAIDPAQIAVSCLRLCGLDDKQVDAATTAASGIR